MPLSDEQIIQVLYEKGMARKKIYNDAILIQWDAREVVSGIRQLLSEDHVNWCTE